MQKKNVTLTLDAQEIIRMIIKKYGEHPVISEIGKRKKAEYERKMIEMGKEPW